MTWLKLLPKFGKIAGSFSEFIGLGFQLLELDQ